MKANAITRIVIWSIVLLLLVGTLIGVLYAVNSSKPKPQIEQPVPSPLYGTVSAQTQVYSAPSTSSAKVGFLVSGDEVEISRQETTNGETWALITTQSYSGWILTNDLHILQEELSVGPVASDKDGSLGAVNAEKIREMEIEWVAGSITIQPGKETDIIRFWDDYSGDEQYLLYYTTEGNKLKIQFCEEDWEDLSFGIHFGNSFSKNLTVEVPADWVCEKLEIESAASKLEVHDLTISEVEIDSASGAIGFESCNVGTLDVDTASGDVIYSGMLTSLDCDGASASIVMTLNNTPKRMDVDTASGNLDITLPENAGFTAKLDSMSGKLNSEFDCEMVNNRYVCGDGACQIDVSALSGNVNIRKNPNLTSAEVTQPVESSTHTHSESCYADLTACAYYSIEGHYHSELCTQDPVSCPYYALEGHDHTDSCAAEPNTCPYYTLEGHYHSSSCESDHSTCPYYALGGHHHSDTCTSDPGSCPDSSDGTHHHTDSCILDSASCPEHSSTQQSQSSGEHHSSSEHH